MLTLFTGMPGAGKTAQMVYELKKLIEKEPGRPIFVDGVRDLKLPHQVIDARTWHTDLPDGALLLIDEVQRIWRPAGPGAKIPDEIAALETHRHRAVDIWMTTQHPRLVHASVRSLVGRHIHLRDTGFLGRWWYEWSEISEGVSWKTCPNKHKHKLPKSIFGEYKSATEHIKGSRRIPPAMFIAAICLVVLAALVFTIGRSIYGKTAAPAAAPAAPQPGSQAVSLPGFTSSAPAVQVPRYITDPTAYTPRWSGKPESAPAYDDLVRVKTFPRVVGGFCQGKSCQCITQQGTDAGLSHSQCREWLARVPFDPYREPAAVADRVDQRAPGAPAVDPS